MVEEHSWKTEWGGLIQLLRENQVRRTTILYGVAGFLHGVLDPAITYIIINKQIGHETNPFLRSVFKQSLLDVFIKHLPLFVILLVCFVILLYLFNISEGSEREQLYWISQSVLTVCIIWGVALVGWNLYILL